MSESLQRIFVTTGMTQDVLRNIAATQEKLQTLSESRAFMWKQSIKRRSGLPIGLNRQLGIQLNQKDFLRYFTEKMERKPW